jgi:hypothetical protein
MESGLAKWQTPPDCLDASWTKRGIMIASATISHVTLEMLRFGAAALTVSDYIIYEEYDHSAQTAVT